MERLHFIGVCGTAMATLAAMLKARGLDVQGSDHNVYPPMSDFLAQEGIRVFDGYDASHITSDITTSSIIGNAISRGNPELEEILDRKIRYHSLPEADSRAVPLERAVDRDRRHARQDDDDGADGVAADRVRRGSERAHRRHRVELRRAATGSAADATSSSRATSTTARSSTRRRSS